MQKYIFTLCVISIINISNAQNIFEKSPWVDSVFNSLSLEQKIGQLFMVAAYSNKDNQHASEILSLINNQHIGGLIFMQGGPERQARLTNIYQSASGIPLMIAMDAEWGSAMRLDSVISYPKQMTLGAIEDNTLIEKMGFQIGTELRRLGVHISFSPVVDINNNSKNPVINIRSFGEDKFNVADKGVAYMKGLQKAKVLANAKHFPGHGDTDSDSHYTLPVVNASAERFQNLELYPFKKLIENHVGSIMVAHLYIPNIDSTKNRASTLSPIIVNEMLKERMGFKGLIFTDALNMRGVSKYYEPGKVEVEALKAGNHVLLFSENVPLAITKIKEALLTGEINQNQIDEATYKILQTKYWLGLNQKQKVSLKNLSTDLNSKKGISLKKQLIEASQTLTKNKDSLLPLKNLSKIKIASLVVGDLKDNSFQKMLSKYGEVTTFATPKATDSRQLEHLKKQLKEFDVVIISLHKLSVFPKNNYGLNQEVINIVNALAQLSCNKVLNLYGNPYIANQLNSLEKYEAVLFSFEENIESQQAAAKLIFGAIPFSGKLPVSTNIFEAGQGFNQKKNIRLNYVLPEEMGVNSVKLKKKVDSLCFEAILQKAIPGTVVLATKNGNIIYEGAYGHHTYESVQPVNKTDLYDLASVTKVAATTLALMKLYDEGKINLNQTLGYYLNWIPEWAPLYHLTLREVLAHQSGLPSWIPFYQKTQTKPGELSKGYYQNIKSDLFPINVAENLFLHFSFRDSIYCTIYKSKLSKKEYKYSDIGFYFLSEIIETITKMDLDVYVDSVFYNPMGLQRIRFKPKNKFNLNQIVPTENDVNFRKQLIHGFVHDPGAALLGGVAGHAGLFSDAFSLASLGQMLLNKGVYGGEKYLSERTIDYFTSCQYCNLDNRRAIGWDKPVKEGSGPTFNGISQKSFGHSGFTGTLWWVDPEEQIVYVFLSNRVHPNAENNKLQKGNFRSKVQKTFYSFISETKLNKPN